MRPYDDKEYRYTSSDPDKAKALEVISGILGFEPSILGLDYSLSFYSGGDGIYDRLGFRCNFDSANLVPLIGRLQLKRPSEAIADPNWAEDFCWLVCGEKPVDRVDEQCYGFINSNKFPYQSSPGPTSDVYFSNESDVNHWSVVWVENDQLNYLYFDQG